MIIFKLSRLKLDKSLELPERISIKNTAIILTEQVEQLNQSQILIMSQTLESVIDDLL